MSRTKIAILGAGPIGLEAGVYAAHLDYDVEIFEAESVGHNILSWGHVTLFSPWEMNHSPLSVALLKKHASNWQEPSPEAYMTGRDYVETYLRPLSQLPHLRDGIRTGRRVLDIGRERIFKGDLIGDARRTDHRFRLLTVDGAGNEDVHHADVVIDATGVYGNPNWLGDGGIPAVGERTAGPHIAYGLEDIYGAARSRYAGKRTLVVGAGYSAATTICDFQNLIREEPNTSVLWIIREDREEPIPPIDNDPLPIRARLTETANQIVRAKESAIEFRNNTTVHAVQYDQNRDAFTVGFRRQGNVEEIDVDRIIANVGYGPDNSLYRELQIHECYASRGPMKLAAALLASSSADCLDQTSQGPETLTSPEPNFFLLGNKSYGRNSTFLIRVGLSQIQEAFTLITGKKDLNLYETSLGVKAS